MYLKAAKIPPGGRLRRGSGQSAWDYPQGSRLFAHATDTDDAATPPTAVSDCLGARAVGPTGTPCRHHMSTQKVKAPAA